MLIDVHTHITDKKFDADVEKVIEDSNCAVIINNGMNVEDNRKTIELSKKFSKVKVALGIHPYDIVRMDEKDIDEEIKFISKQKIIAIGEIGLDFTYEEKEKQIKYFKKFLDLAKKMGFPVIVHSRKAENEVLENLSNAIFNLEKNQVSEVVETALAKHIVVLNNIYPEKQATLNESKQEITDTLLQVELESFIIDLKNNISQQILDGLSLNEIAIENSLKIENLKNAERNKIQAENDLIKNQVIAKGFASNKDFVSDIEDLDDGRSFIVNVDNIENERPHELKEVFEIVSSDWIDSLKIESINTQIDKILEGSKSLEEIANFVKKEILNEDMKLDSNLFPTTLKNKVFTDEIKQISLSISNKNIYISQLKQISFPKEEPNNTQALSLLSELRSNFGAEIIKDKNISTNDNLIQALINQY